MRKLALLVTLVLTSVCLADETKIVLLAGGNLDKTKPSGQHEYLAGSLILQKLLEQTAGVKTVLVKDGWPSDEKVFEGAKAVVFYMDGGGRAPHTQSPEKMNAVQKLVDKGIGIVHLHQVIDYPMEPGQRAKAWLGGVYLPNSGARGHWDGTFSQFAESPVTLGVGPFTMNDGFILKLTWVDDMKGITPLMRTWNPKGPAKSKETDDIVAWTYDRPAATGGGRTFVFTGMHGHDEWGIEGLRKFVTNGVLWAAGVDVPANGAPVALDAEELKKNLDERVKATPKKKAAAKS
jgi:type 1 glutamine amidotransferase